MEKLRAVGFTEPQAEAFSHVVVQAHEANTAALVSRQELLATEARLQASIAETRHEHSASIVELRHDLRTTEARLQASLAETKAEILKWMVSAIGLQTAAVIGAVIALIRFMR